jgi:phospholipid transport system transporter-binding protein
LNAPADITAADGRRFRIDGVLDFDTVPQLMKQAQKLFAVADQVQVDFAGVTGCNSAGLALLLEMDRVMKQRNKPIQFFNLPQQIRTFAEAYAVDDELEAMGLLSR